MFNAFEHIEDRMNNLAEERRLRLRVNWRTKGSKNPYEYVKRSLIRCKSSYLLPVSFSALLSKTKRVRQSFLSIEQQQ